MVSTIITLFFNMEAKPHLTQSIRKAWYINYKT